MSQRNPYRVGLFIFSMICIVMSLILFSLKVASIGMAAHMSWWWIISPLWLPIAGSVSIILLIIVIEYIVRRIEGIFKFFKRRAKFNIMLK